MQHEICNIVFYVYDDLHHSSTGSSSFITNIEGSAEQHLQYLPFGELFVSQRNSDFNSRYKFTAKELDNETNYTYFGARYYDSDLSVWLSVDPLSDKYPSLSPYAYVANNPIVLVDPDGMQIDEYFTATGKYLGSDGDKNSNNIRIVDEQTYNNLLGTNDAQGKPLLQTSGDAVLFNDAEMTKKARLAIYEHFNETGLPLTIANDNKGSRLMAYISSIRGNDEFNFKIEINDDRIRELDYMNNFYSIKSSFDHEYGHHIDRDKVGGRVYRDLPTSLKEIRAIWHQKSTSNWPNTPEKYKENVNRYFNDNFNNYLHGK